MAGTTCILQIIFEKIIEFFIDNIFVPLNCLEGVFSVSLIGIQMGANCAPLFADLFLYLHENEFLLNMIRSGHKTFARSFNLCYRYTDDLIVSKVGDYSTPYNWAYLIKSFTLLRNKSIVFRLPDCL